MILFDNTAKIKAQARKNERFCIDLYNRSKGSEVQAYEIGQAVSGEGLGFISGKIIDIYTEHGYIYYVIEISKGFTKTLRQKDIKLI